MKKIPLLKILVTSFALLAGFTANALAGDVLKANNGTGLSLTTSWVSGVLPVSTDVAVWDSTVATARTANIGGNMSWQGIRVAGAIGLQTIGNTANMTLSLGSSGIDMSASNTDMTISAVLNYTANQTWSIASGRTLTVGATNTGSVAINVTGPGNLRLSSGTAFGTSTLTLGGDVNIGSSSTTARNIGVATTLGGNITITNITTTAGNSSITFTGGLATGAADRTVSLFTSAAGSGTAFVPSATISSAVTGTGALIFANGSSGTNPLQSVYFKTVASVATGLTLGTGITTAFSAVNLLGASARLQIDSGGTLQLADILSISTYRSITNNQTVGALNGAGTVTSEATANVQGTLTVDSSVTNVDSTFSGTITNNATAKLGLAKAGSNTLTLSGTNSYTGTTTVTGGTLQFAKQTSLYNNTPASWTAANIIVNSGATLALNVGGSGEFASGDVDTIKALGGASNGFKSGSILGLDTTNASGGIFTYNTVIANTNAGANAVGLKKLGANTLELTAANTYTGATVVSSGTLLVSGGTLNTSSGVTVDGGLFDYTNNTTGLNRNVTVNSGATFRYNSTQAYTGALTLNSGGTLGGAGNLGTTAVTVGSGQTLSPGNSPGNLATGAQTWANGGNYNWQIVDAVGLAGTGYDTTTITGGLDLSGLTAGGFNVNLWSLSGISPDVNGDAHFFTNTNSYAWTIASASGGISGFNATNFTINTGAINGTGGFTNTLAPGRAFSMSVAGNDLVLNYTAVPEPATWALLAFSLTTVMVFRRRRA